MEPSEVLDKVLQDQKEKVLQDQKDRILQEQKPLRTITRGSAMEGLIGLAAAVLSILGLAGLFPYQMLSVSTIVLGAALLIESSTVIGRFPYIMRDIGETQDLNMTSGGMAVESLAGLAGIALGIIALLGVDPVLLSCIAVLGFGAAVTFGASTIAMINSVLGSRPGKSQYSQNIITAMTLPSTDIRMLIGLGTLTLGILGVIGINPTPLAFVGVLAVGAVLFLENISFTVNLMSFLRK